MIPAARRAFSWPTIPSATGRGWRDESSPRPAMCECDAMRERDFRDSVVSEVSLVCIDILEGGERVVFSVEMEW